MKQKQRGFSLIELLIVVVIVAIIAAIAIPSLLAARRSANETMATQMVQELLKVKGSPGQFENKGYVFTVTRDDAKHTFDVTAVPKRLYPESELGTGSYSYYANETGKLSRAVGGNPPGPNRESRADLGGESWTGSTWLTP